MEAWWPFAVEPEAGYAVAVGLEAGSAVAVEPDAGYLPVLVPTQVMPLSAYAPDGAGLPEVAHLLDPGSAHEPGEAPARPPRGSR